MIYSEPTIADFATMHWDGKLQRLYIGLQLTTSSGGGNGAKAIVVARVTGCGVLTLYDILNATAALPLGTNTIIAAINGTDESIAISMQHIRTMHCSTGPSYLIVNGAVNTPDQVNNLVYAIPLVDICPESPIQGTVANKNAALSYKHTFMLPAAAEDELTLADDVAAQVGAGPLPIQPTTPISDIVVVGDTVYVSIAQNRTKC